MRSYKLGDQVNVEGTLFTFSEEGNGRLTYSNGGPNGVIYSILVLPDALAQEWEKAGKIRPLDASDDVLVPAIHRHEWKNYMGLTKTYLYCECGKTSGNAV